MKWILALICLLLLPLPTLAVTPTISNVTGTVSTGQTLTITGTHMMDDSKTTSAGSFEGASFTSDGWLDPGNSGANIPTYDSSVKILGSKSVKFHVDGPSASNVASYLYTSVGGGTDVWYRYYVRYNATSNIWFDNYAKQLYIMSGGAWNYYFDVNGTGGGLPSGYSTTSGSSGWSVSGNNPSGQLVNGRWYLVEAHIVNSATQGSRVFDIYVDNQSTPMISVPTTDLDGNMPQQTLLFGIPNAKQSPSGLSVDNWWDGLAWGSSARIYGASIIEISGDGGSTWKYQPPTSLSDTTSTITADLPTGSSFLLRVTNNLQQTSTTYSLSGGHSTGDIKTYVGGSFKAAPVKVYVGGSWKVAPVKVYNGSAWVATPY